MVTETREAARSQRHLFIVAAQLVQLLKLSKFVWVLRRDVFIRNGALKRQRAMASVAKLNVTQNNKI
jgi:flagellar biogenesis protein FliO